MRAVFGLGIYLCTGLGQKTVKNDVGDWKIDPPPRYNEG